MHVADRIDLIFRYPRPWTEDKMKRVAAVAVSILGVVRDLQKVCQTNDWLFEDGAPFLAYKVDLLLRRHQLRGLRGTSRLGYKRYGCPQHRTQDLVVQLQEYYRLGESTGPYAYNAVAPGAPIDLVQLATIYQTGPGRLGYHDFDKEIQRVARLHSTSRFGPPRPPVAILSPPCRLPVAVLALSAPCRSPVACLSLPCRCPVAPLSLSCRFPVAFLPPSCRYPVASCRFLSFPVAMLLFSWHLPVALLSLSCQSHLSLSCRYFPWPPCRPPVACLASSCRLPVASLSPPCRLPVAQRGNLSLSCRLPVACLSLACRLPAASLSPPCRLPVASLSPNVGTCRSPVACLSLACRLPVAFLSPPCRLPVASLSPNVLPYRWKAIDTSNNQFYSTKNVLCSCQIVRSHLSKPPQRCAKQ